MAKPPKAKTAAKKPRAKKSPAKAVKKIDTPAPAPPRKDRRGTPKGKGVAKGKRGGGKIGNPPFAPTPEQRLIVRTHAACGTPHWLIAEMVTPPISLSTLTKYFRPELDNGLLQINARMASLIAKQALGGCRTSQRLWMVTRGGWSMKSTTELSGPDGSPVMLAVPARNPNTKLLTDKELEEYERLQSKLEGQRDASDG